MQALETLRTFFGQESEVAAVYVYGTYAVDRSWPDTDIEIALLFPDSADEDAIAHYLNRLTDAGPLGDHPGTLMPFALNNHILPVLYEILQGGTLLVDNDPATRLAFTRRTEQRLADERPALLEEAREAISQARSLGLGATAADAYVLPRPPRYLDPIRVGWRLARILGSVVVLEQLTRDLETLARDGERLASVAGWYSNGVGAATGIAKAMLNIFGMPRPARRWEVFVPLADSGLVPMELALRLAAAVELRWSLIAGGTASGERMAGGVRAALAPLTTFARLAAWYCELPGAGVDQKVH